MNVNYFGDHIAYTFEDNENIFSLGTRVLSKIGLRTILLSESVIYNGQVRLLYNLHEKKSICEIIGTLPEAEVISLLMDYLKVIVEIFKNDFIDIKSLDVNIERLYYDTKSKQLNCIILPINEEYDFHDGASWQEKYRNSLAYFCSYIFATNSDKYTKMYYKITDLNLTDIEIAEYLYTYDFGITKSILVNSDNNIKSDEIRNRVITLEHSSQLGNILFRISQNEFVLGKSATNADGTISISTSISRRHCIIRKNQEGFTVEDLGSSNGTRINGYGISSGQQYMLNKGDFLQLADIVFVVGVEW